MEQNAVVHPQVIPNKTERNVLKRINSLKKGK